MKQIRRKVFETNSSSTHSLTMVPAEIYNKWENGELYRTDSGAFISDKSTYIKANSWEDDPKSYDEWVDTNDNLQTFSQEYTTPGGENIVAFGRYGYDG